MKTSLETLADRHPPKSPRASCAEIYRLFEADRDLLSVAIVDENKPVGLVNRHDFILSMAHQCGRALYDRQPITSMMDAGPLVVDTCTPLETLNRLIVDEKPSALLKGFIITRNDAYLGIGTSLALLQLTNIHMQERARELDDA